MNKRVITSVTNFFNQWHQRIHRFALRCKKDNIKMAAGYLSYVTLLSLVPLLAVSFSVISAFPVFETFRKSVELFIFTNFVPTSSAQIQSHMLGFVTNVSKMGTIGILALIVVALMLISSIDASINRIFAVKQKRPLVIKFSIYWMVLTLGPLIAGASLGVSSYLVSLAAFAENYSPGISDFFIRLLPFVLSTFGFFVLYMLVPNKLVNWKAAFYGAIFAGVLFEVSKRVFAFYVTSFPSYQVIYGALAAIPILFLWVYLSWILVLMGAELTVMIEEYQSEKADKERNGEQYLPTHKGK
ncbi:virulence factor BrkB family protein [Flocculibacter collagenilyticus]|uniref:virulence factor BrkB family protein n=1 Tax=Flocculibacter collagenilyticus TaxID=2744479 RepID=UPI0018F47DDE|nr:virulence factor BrkB family protein [Flocculibacter collagenilyticus]